jgi:isopenicillin-N epimerase
VPHTRRAFLETMAVPAALCAGGVGLPAIARAARSGERQRAFQMPTHSGAPEAAASDEDYWFQVAQAFTIDRSILNLNNGGVSPAPFMVQEAMKRHLDFSNTAPPPYALWQILEPQKEAVRERMAAEFGCDPEEIAFTRNSSESLQICQLGFDLRPGDEVLTTTQDYPRMITTFKQRERRDGLVLKQFKLPIPCEDPSEAVSLFERNITPKTRMILMSHIINITGQILPVREVVAMARTKNGGIPVIVDGAHALAHFDFKLSDLGCDYYGVSLHKWLFAPHGTGLLYVRKDKIKSLWPMMPAPDTLDSDIRKFEEIGTHPAANTLAISEALTFHQGIGGKRKEARLRYLRDTWANRLLQSGKGRVRIHTSLKAPQPLLSCGIATVEIDGLETPKLQSWLWDKHRILTVAIKHDEFNGLRITPSVYTSMPDLDRFCTAVETAMRDGLPSA